jgi:cell division control protein 6
MSQNIRQLMESELNDSNELRRLFKDENVLTFDFMPDSLPHREHQILEMTRLFRSLFTHPLAPFSFRQTAILVGTIGSGKTSVAKRFGTDLEELAVHKLVHVQLIYRHLNCRRTRTVYLLLIELMRSILPDFPPRGFSSSELLRELLTTLETANLYLLLTLDEIDYLFRDNEINTLLYAFTRLNDDAYKSVTQRISLIIITRNHEFLYLLDPSTKSTLGKNIIHFPPYTMEQLENILKHRLEAAVKPDIVNSDVLAMIASIAHDKGSDARFAIELLWRTIKIAESASSTDVKVDHVRLAQNSVNAISKEIFIDLPLQQKVVLLSIGKLFQQNPSKSRITLTMVKRQYHIESRRLKVAIGQGHTSLWSYVKKLWDLGLIQAQVVNRGTKGRVTEIQLDLPVDLLVSEVEQLIKQELTKLSSVDY